MAYTNTQVVALLDLIRELGDSASNDGCETPWAVVDGDALARLVQAARTLRDLKPYLAVCVLNGDGGPSVVAYSMPASFDKSRITPDLVFDDSESDVDPDDVDVYTFDLDALAGCVLAPSTDGGQGGGIAGEVPRDQDDMAEADEAVAVYRNHYKCSQCEEKWADVWSAQCDDDCPKCGARHISPLFSEDVLNAPLDPAASPAGVQPSGLSA